MAIKGGDLIHTGNLILIDRAQTAGPGQVTINREKIYELGNYFSLASITDIPDLTFSLESFDASAEFEALLLNKTFEGANGTQTVTLTGNPTGGTFTLTYGATTTAAIAYNATPAAVQAALEALVALVPGDVMVTGQAGGPYLILLSPPYLTANTATALTADATALTGTGTPAVTVASYPGVRMLDGTVLNPAACVPMDVASAFKPGFKAANLYDVIGSIAIPFLQLESLSYKFGFADTASQSASLKGDSIFYNPNSTFVEEFVGTNTANQVVTATNTAVVYHGDTVNGATVGVVFTKATRFALSVSLASGKRLLPGADYSETATGAGPGYALAVTILAAVPATDKIRIIYASTTPATYPQASHAPVTPVRPAAIKGRNVEVFVGGQNLINRWTSVQSVSVDWKVTLEKDQEMGNSQVVSQTYDVPAVTGSIDLKPRDYAELYTKVCEIAGVTVGEVAGALTTVPLELRVVLHSPDDGTVLKTIIVPDARFTLPGYSGKAGVGTKIDVTFAFESDGGIMNVVKGVAA